MPKKRKPARSRRAKALPKQAGSGRTSRVGKRQTKAPTTKEKTKRTFNFRIAPLGIDINKTIAEERSGYPAAPLSPHKSLSLWKPLVKIAAWGKKVIQSMNGDPS